MKKKFTFERFEATPEQINQFGLVNCVQPDGSDSYWGNSKPAYDDVLVEVGNWILMREGSLAIITANDIEKRNMNLQKAIDNLVSPNTGKK